MLVYAYSCAHAKSLCQIIGGHAPGLRVDWVGTGPNGRSDTENTNIIGRFKGGAGDVLVQVNIASEGFNCPPVSVIVDLSLTGFGPQKLQAYGRGTRVYYGFPLVIYIPTDSNVARHAYRMAGLFDLPVDTEAPSGPCTCCPACPRCEHHEGKLFDLPDLHVLSAMLIGGHDFEPTAAQVYDVATRLSRRLDPKNNPEDFQEVYEAMTAVHRIKQEEMSEGATLAFWQEKVTKAVSTVAVNVALKIHGRVEKSLMGDLCRRINGRWKHERRSSHDMMTAGEFEQKYTWLIHINDDVKLGTLPVWLA